MNKKIIVANYRYHITGGPEVYMFKFMEKSELIGYDSIPFSVNYKQNVSTKYSKYFIKPRSDGVYYDNIKKTPIGIYRTFKGAFYNIEANRKLKKLIKDEKPEVLYALQVINTLSPSIFKIAKKNGLKVVHRISDFNMICPRSDLLRNGEICKLCIKGDFNYCINNRCIHNSKLPSIIRAESMKFHRKKNLYKYVDYFVTPTNYTRNLLIEGGFDPKKIVTIPTFIDSSTIKPNYSNKNYLLFLGRMSPEKGYRYAIEAMKYLKKYNDLKLYITGEYDKLDDDLKKFIVDNHLEDKMIFTGFVRGEKLQNLISNSLCILCPAIWYDNMPNTVIEAYSYGKPVIASNLGCFTELVEDGKTGFLFEPKNSEDLSNKISNLIDKNLAEDFGRYSRNLVENKYNVMNHLKKLEEIFKK